MSRKANQNDLTVSATNRASLPVQQGTGFATGALYGLPVHCMSTCPVCHPVHTQGSGFQPGLRQLSSSRPEAKHVVKTMPIGVRGTVAQALRNKRTGMISIWPFLGTSTLAQSKRIYSCLITVLKFKSDIYFFVGHPRKRPASFPKPSSTMSSILGVVPDLTIRVPTRVLQPHHTAAIEARTLGLSRAPGRLDHCFICASRHRIATMPCPFSFVRPAG